MPVLSEQISGDVSERSYSYEVYDLLVIPPRASRALRFRVRTFLFRICVIPVTKVIVSTAIRDSGIIAMPEEVSTGQLASDEGATARGASGSVAYQSR